MSPATYPVRHFFVHPDDVLTHTGTAECPCRNNADPDVPVRCEEGTNRIAQEGETPVQRLVVYAQHNSDQTCERGEGGACRLPDDRKAWMRANPGAVVE